jgi:hypothetical protein
MLFKRYKSYLLVLIVSIIAIISISLIYSDIYEIYKQTDTNLIIKLLVAKWLVIFAIIWLNFKAIKKIHTKEKDDKSTKSIKDTSTSKPISAKIKNYHNTIISKKKLKSKSDRILEKYLGK